MKEEKQWHTEVIKVIKPLEEEEYYNRLYHDLKGNGWEARYSGDIMEVAPEMIPDLLIAPICYFEVREEYEKCAILMPIYQSCLELVTMDEFEMMDHLGYKAYLLRKFRATLNASKV